VTLVEFLLLHLPDDKDRVDGGNRALSRNLKSWFNIRLTKKGIHDDDVEAYQDVQSQYQRAKTRKITKLIQASFVTLIVS
jgi:hypothetical protein